MSIALDIVAVARHAAIGLLVGVLAFMALGLFASFFLQQSADLDRVMHLLLYAVPLAGGFVGLGWGTRDITSACRRHRRSSETVA